MREWIRFVFVHRRDLLFAACAACTLWLIVQNTVLFAMLSWHGMPTVFRVAGTLTRAAIALAVPSALVTGVVWAAWHRARVPHAMEGRHD